MSDFVWFVLVWVIGAGVMYGGFQLKDKKWADEHMIVIFFTWPILPLLSWAEIIGNLVAKIFQRFRKQ